MPWFLRKDGRDWCPLCWTEVPDAEKPDTSLPARLRLSGNHRISIDPAAFETRMRTISDHDLQAALLAPAGGFDREVRLHALTGAPGRQFLSATEYRALLAGDDRARADVQGQASEVEAHRIGYGSFRHSFGPVVDFNHGFGTPGMKYGFHYWQWAMPLVSAYALEPSGRWAASFAELFAQWYAQRDAVRDELANLDADVIWYELGLAVRTPVFIDALLLLSRDEAFPAAAEADLRRTVLGHCRWLHECSSRNPYHAYNWPIQVSVTLRHAGTLLPHLREAAAWRDQADSVISEHLRRDFQADGGYQERTPNYTMYVLDLFATYARLLETHPAADGEAAERERGIVARIREATERCLAAWAELMTPLGLPPAVNDTSRSAPLARVLVDGAREHGRRDFLGPASLADGIPAGRGPVEFPERLSVHLPETGFAVMRSDWTRRARCFFLNLAPWAVHTHEDILSFECYADGAALAVDPGLAAAGYGDGDHAGWYQAARGHNMLCVEEADPARHLARGEDVRWFTGPRHDFAAATHDGYREAFGVRHRRHVLFLKPHAWIIRDLVWAELPGLKLDWFLHSPMGLVDTEAGWSSPEAPGLVVAAAEADRYGRRRGQGPADLAGLPGQPAHRLIDWVSYRWTTREGPQPEDIAVLLAPAARRAEIRGAGAAGSYEVVLDGLRLAVRMDVDGAECREIS